MARKGKIPPPEGAGESAAAVAEDAPAPAPADAAPAPAPAAETNGVEAPPPAEEAKVNGDDAVKTKKEKKPVKKSIPEWATLSDSARKAIPKAQMAKPRFQDTIVAAITACADSKGVASAGSIRKFIMKDNPDLPKMVLKKGVKKALEKGLIKQVKGNGFSGSFKLESAKNVAKAKAKDEKAAAKGKGKGKAKASASKDRAPLESVFPSLFTWATNPKEASVGLIRKYIAKHYPELDVEGKSFKNAIDGAETRGQLRRLTGKGFSGTFELVDGANKTGGKYEDAIENAIISMNEPKQVSVTGIRDYLSCWHAEYNTDNRPLVLKKALDRCSEKGWLQQISGKGFSGTYRLMHPYYPAPRELWGEYFQEKEERKPRQEKESPRKASKRAVVESSDEEEEESEDDISDDEEVMPTPKKRGAPKPRSYAAAMAKKKKPAVKAAKKPTKKATKKPVAKKSKPAGQAKRGKRSKK